MEKEHFLFLAQNYTSLTAEEANELIALQSDYPYSQAIHNLCSRAAQDANLDQKDKFLHASAIYTTERTVLKSIMTAPRETRSATESHLADKKAEVEVKAKIEEIAPAIVAPKKQEPGAVIVPTVTHPESPPALPSRSEALIQDLKDDIEKLREARTKFEKAMELLDSHAATTIQSVTDETKKKSKKGVAEPADTLIEEIKTKKKVKPEGAKQKEQIEIIESFIKYQPTITKNKLSSQPADSGDLAEKSLMFGDHIVSETLVEILLKQGKKDKAIEVLKKLIWKIPQKKAYFAARIEELKK